MNIKQISNGTELIIAPEGRLDTTTAPEFEKVVKTCLDGISHLIFDFENLDYVSSAGLRIILLAQKTMTRQGDMVIKNANAVIMEIFEVTGFIDILTIEVPDAIKKITLDESKMMGRGANGAVYQYQNDSIVKVYFNSSALEEIEREKKYAREALILGLPTAISLGIVQVGDKFGLEYEFIKSNTLSREIMEHPELLDTYIKKFALLGREVHATERTIGKKETTFLSMKDSYHNSIDKNGIFTEEQKVLVHEFINSIPDATTLLHGDFHTGNIMISGEELLMIDIADISYGHPIFDIAGSILTFKIVQTFFNQKNPTDITVIGLSIEKAAEAWDVFVREYFSDFGFSKEKIESIIEFSEVIAGLKVVITVEGVALPNKEAMLASVKDAVNKKFIPNLSKYIGKLDWEV